MLRLAIIRSVYGARADIIERGNAAVRRMVPILRSVGELYPGDIVVVGDVDGSPVVLDTWKYTRDVADAGVLTAAVMPHGAEVEAASDSWNVVNRDVIVAPGVLIDGRDISEDGEKLDTLWAMVTGGYRGGTAMLTRTARKLDTTIYLSAVPASRKIIVSNGTDSEIMEVLGHTWLGREAEVSVSRVGFYDFPVGSVCTFLMDNFTELGINYYRVARLDSSGQEENIVWMGDLRGFAGKPPGTIGLFVGSAPSGDFMLYSTDDQTLRIEGGWIMAKDGYFQGAIESRALEAEMMKIVFSSTTWSQFAIADFFDDESLRASPEPGAYPATIYRGRLITGDVPHREYTFTSKLYSDILRVFTGTITSVSGNWAYFPSDTFFSGQYQGYRLHDANGNVFDIQICEPNRLYLSGTATVGNCVIRAKNPTYVVGLCDYQDSTNGGYGYTRLEFTANATNWQTLLDTQSGVNLLGAAITLSNPGRDYQFRVTLKNDANGKGPIVRNVFIFTDPSVWG